MTGPRYTDAPLARALDDAGFEHAKTAEPGGFLGGAEADWWDLADADLNVVARVTVTAEDGIEMFAFTGGRATLLAWQARFSGLVPPMVLAEGVAALKGWALAEEMVRGVTREGFPPSDPARGAVAMYPKARRDPSVVHTDLPIGSRARRSR